MDERGFEVEVTLHRGGRALALGLRSGARRIGLLGPSGAGKTTLVRVLAGLERKCRGRIRIGGRSLLEGEGGIPAWERRVGWVPQEATLFPHASVEENLAWGVGSGSGAATPLEMAEALGIAHLLTRRPRHLSGGERQRVALGRALLARPRLLLLDEPFTALDPEHRAQAAGVIDAHLIADPAMHLLLVSHHSADLTRLCEETWAIRTDGSLHRA